MLNLRPIGTLRLLPFGSLSVIGQFSSWGTPMIIWVSIHQKLLEIWFRQRKISPDISSWLDAFPCRSLFAPSSFGEYHAGDVHSTFVSPDGEHSARIDYVALPRHIPFDSITTRVDDTLDVSLHRPDHFPPLCWGDFLLSFCSRSV